MNNSPRNKKSVEKLPPLFTLPGVEAVSWEGWGWWCYFSLFFLFFNTLELHWHVYCMVRIPHALIKKHYHLLTSPLHQLQQDNRLPGCEEASRYSQVSSISPTQHPSSHLQTQHKCFSPRQLKRKASRLWSGNCLLSIRETWLAFCSPALHIYQGKLKETQEGVLLSNNPARFYISAHEWNWSAPAAARETHVKLRGFALCLHVVVEAGIVFPYDVPLLLLSFSSLCDSVHKKKWM